MTDLVELTTMFLLCPLKDQFQSVKHPFEKNDQGEKEVDEMVSFILVIDHFFIK